MNPSLFRALMQRAAAPSESDAELLGQFAATRDEPAFAELVRRYAGLVWGQCRHLLPNEADAEDAFQATFLALARRPGAVRTAVGPYLHGVAYRVCQNARRLAGRRKKHEVASATSEATHPVADSAWDAALAAVYAEVHRLPEPQRVAFVLCVLEGRGLTDAAAELGVKLGTLSARLSRAKRVVMDRLAARGILAGMAAVSALAPGGATGAVVDKAVQTAVGAAVVPAMVQSLTHGVTNMAAFKLKALAAGVLLASGLTLGVGSGWLANAQDRGEKGPPVATLPKVAKLVAPPTEFKYVPVPNNQFATAAEFEKLVRDNETGGYTFAGCVPLKGFNAAKGNATVPALVFRKTPNPDKEKLYAVNFDKVPWTTVMDVLAKELELTTVGEARPQGTCTIKLNRKLPAGELMDLLNEVLAQQKLVLVRGEQTLRLWPADKPVPQLFVPSVRVEDLPNRGKSEIVSVVIPLIAGTAEDALTLAKKRKSPLGEVTLLGQSQLFVRDSAGAVAAIATSIRKLNK